MYWGTIVDAFPIAKLQGGMIFHNQFNPEQALYHDIFSYRIRVVLDLALLQLVIDDLVARHPALRTSFGWLGSKVNFTTIGGLVIGMRILRSW